MLSWTSTLPTRSIVAIRDATAQAGWECCRCHPSPRIAWLSGRQLGGRMAALSLPLASNLDQQEMGHGAGILRIVSPDGLEKPQRKRNAPRSRSRKPTEEINFLAQLEQRGVQGVESISRQEDVFPLDHFFMQDARLPAQDPIQRTTAPTPSAGRRSKPQGEPPKRSRPPAAKRAKPEGEHRPASQRQRGLLLIKSDRQNRQTKGGSLLSLSVKPTDVVGDDSATESEGQMVRRGMASSTELRDQGGAAVAASAFGGGRTKSGAAHTVSSSGSDAAARARGMHCGRRTQHFHHGLWL